MLIAVRKVDIARYRLTIALLHHTTNLIIRHGGGIAHLLSTSFYIAGVLLTDTGTQGLRQPIGIDTTGHGLGQCIILLVKLGLGIRSLCRIAAGIQFYLQLLCCITHVVGGEVGHFHAYMTCVGDAQTSHLGLHCFYNNDAVAGLGTVDGLGRAVFKHRDRLDAVDVEVENLLLCRLETVEDKQWCVGITAVFALQTAE